MTTTRTTCTALTGLALVLALAGCSTGTPEASDPTTAPVVVETTTPVEPTPEPTPEVAADEFSQVINGVLYQGSEKAPVRIGTDTPGQPPAAQAQITNSYTEADVRANWGAAQSAGKYLVTINERWSDRMGGTAGGSLEGYYWMVQGWDRWGSWRPLATAGDTGSPFPTAEAAIADPKVVDGRVLDAAEYVLANFAG